MKILVICQYYSPEPFRISDICEELIKKGHEVTVVTGIPNYPMGEIYEGYRNGDKRDEIINGVKVHRCLTIGRKTGAVRRFLNYYSYAISSTLYVSKLKDDYDVVFVNQLSPVMMANAGLKYKKKHNKKLILYCLDLWPESLVAGVIKRDSLIYKYFHRVSEKIYKQVDKILITSQMFRQYFKNEFGIEDNIEYLPQYAESIFDPDVCRKEPDGKIDLLFAGNIGVAQSVQTIIRAANETKDIINLRWHIVGDGSELENCKKLAQELGVTSITFYGRKPIEDMPKYYAMADAMLVTLQADPILSMTLPGKVQSYMAAGKPIIGVISGETNQVIKDTDCGLCCEAEDFNALAKCVYRFSMTNDHSKMGKNAKKYYINIFSKDIIIGQLEEALLH